MVFTLAKTPLPALSNFNVAPDWNSDPCTVISTAKANWPASTGVTLLTMGASPAGFPPVVVFRITLPTAHAVEGFTASMFLMVSGTPESCQTQLTPPSLLLRMPFWPTTQTLLESAISTAESKRSPLTGGVQLCPPLLLTKAGYLASSV